MKKRVPQSLKYSVFCNRKGTKEKFFRRIDFSLVFLHHFSRDLCDLIKDATFIMRNETKQIRSLQYPNKLTILPSFSLSLFLCFSFSHSNLNASKIEELRRQRKKTKTKLANCLLYLFDFCQQQN